MLSSGKSRRVALERADVSEERCEDIPPWKSQMLHISRPTITISHLCLDLFSTLFCSFSYHDVVYSCLLSYSCYMPYQTYLCDFIILIIFGRVRLSHYATEWEMHTTLYRKHCSSETRRRWKHTIKRITFTGNTTAVRLCKGLNVGGNTLLSGLPLQETLQQWDYARG
jgi:hypothetical protein